MGWGRISNRADALGTNGGTSGSLGTVGASLIVVTVGYDPRGSGLTLNDSKSNSWLLIGTVNAAVFLSLSMYYCASPVTDGAHTFSFGGASSFASIAISAYSGGAVSPLDQVSAGASGGGISSIQPGSITPTADNELVVTGCAPADSVTANSLDSGFTPSGADSTWQVAAQSFVRDGVSMGFLIQGSAAAVNPTWGASGSTTLASIQASFFVGPPGQPPTGGSFSNSAPRPRALGGPALQFRTQPAFLPSPFQPDPNPASFRSSNGPMFGRGGPSPSNRFRSQLAFDPFSGNIVGQWRNVTPGGLDLNAASNGGQNFGPLIIVADPVRQNVIWFGCQSGVYQSTDYGLNWGKVNFGTGGAALDSGRVWGLQIDKNPNRNPNTTPRLYCVVGYASPTGNQGVWVTTDDGFSWTQVTPGFTAGFVNQIGIDPLDSLHLVATSHNDTQIAETQDGGNTWTILATAAPTTAGWISVITRGTWLTGDFSGVYQTVDFGNTWRQVTTSSSAHGGQQLAKLKGGPQLYLGQDNITQRSDDYGGTWTTVEGTANASVVLATPTFLYTTFGFATQGFANPTLQRASRKADTVWNQNYTTTPLGMTNGGNSGAVIFDGVQYVLLYACGLAGIWRYAEGAQILDPLVTYPEPIPPRRAPNHAFGPSIARSFRSDLLRGAFAVVIAGTTFTQSLAGTLTSAGALQIQTQKVLAGTLTSAGTLLKQTQKLLAGTLTSSGVLAATRVILKALAGTLTSAGTLAIQTGKVLGGTLTSSGTVIKKTGKLLAGTLTSSGTLAGVRVVLKALAGTLSSSGTLVKQTQTHLAGVLSASGTVVKLTRKAIAGVLSFVGSLFGGPPAANARLFRGAQTGVVQATGRQDGALVKKGAQTGTVNSKGATE